MSGGSVDGQAARTVERQIGLGKDDSVNVVFIDRGVRSAICQGVLRLLCQGNEHLICLQGIDGGGRAAGDIRAAEDELHLVVLPGVHHDLTVGESAGEKVDCRQW